MNENYAMPPMPDGSKEGILRGIYKFKASKKKADGKKVHLLGSGSILTEVLKAQEMLNDRYGVAADVWSVTSYKELYRDVLETEHWNLLNPTKKPKVPYITDIFSREKAAIVAASDYVKALPASIAKWLPGEVTVLGTDGFGRSETRQKLRDFFEVDARYIALAALNALFREGKIKPEVIKKAMKEFKIDAKKLNPLNQ
jgi:pyruvate dehydrogenase E1 component